MLWLASSVGTCAGWAACQACQAGLGQLTRFTRAFYAFLFLTSLVISWLLRDYAKPLIQKIPWIMRGRDVEALGDAWYGAQAVLRLALGTTLFFLTLALLLHGVTSTRDRRSKYIHKGSWALKGIAYIVLLILPFFFSNGVVHAYANLARVGAGMFLVMQMVIMLDATHTANDALLESEDPRSPYLLVACTVLAYLGTVAVTTYSFVVFVPDSGTCTLNLGLLVGTFTLILIFSLLSVHPAIPAGSLFPSSVIALYCAYLIYQALASEPASYVCNTLRSPPSSSSAPAPSSPSQASPAHSGLAVNMAVTLCAVAYAALRVGSDTRAFFGWGTSVGTGDDDDDDDDDDRDPCRGRGRHERRRRPASDNSDADDSGDSDSDAGLNSEDDITRAMIMRSDRELKQATMSTSAGVDGEEDDVESRRGRSRRSRGRPIPYHYSFFHTVFALASMYIAMVMTGWGLADAAVEVDVVDVGWGSVVVKLIAVLFAAGLYTWSLIAPVVLEDRDFS